MQNIIEEFILQLHTKKDTSSNTEISYKRDLTKFFEYLNIGSIEEIKNITKVGRVIESQRNTLQRIK